MIKTVAQYKEEISALADRVEAISQLAKAENRDYTAEEATEVDSIVNAGGKIDALKASLERAEKIEALQIEAARKRGVANIQSRDVDGSQKPSVSIPARARKNFNFKAFENTRQGEEDAYTSGRWLLASLGDRDSRRWCKERGISVKNALVRNAMSEGDSLKGGVLAPEQFEQAVIVRRENYGVFGPNCRRVPMTGEVMTVPRRLSGLTVYFPGESGAITDSDVTLNDVKLTAKKATTLTKISSELSEDAIVSIADMLADEIAYAHAVKEDQIGFLGDGTSTYGNVMGLDNVLAAGSISTATSTTIGALTLTECEACVAKLLQVPGIQPKWYVHSAIFWNGLARLQVAAGGNAVMDVGGGPQLQFLGYPVVFTQALSSAGTTGTTWGFFGDLSLAATMGVRRGITVAADASRYFEYDQLAIRSTYRYDIVVHEIGTASAGGPIIKCKLG